MKIMFLADVHIGNHKRHGGALVGGMNDRCRRILAVLKQACELAEEKGCTALVVCGDLFDHVSPAPQIIDATLEALSVYNGTVVALVGNHEQNTTNPRDNAVSLLGHAKGVIVVDELRRVPLGTGTDLWCLPFNPKSVTEWLEAALKSLRTDVAHAHPMYRDERNTRIVCAHFGIIDASTSPWLRTAHDAVHIDFLAPLLARYGVPNAFVGNWHNRQRWDSHNTTIVQCGALVPTGFNNEGMSGYGNVHIFDTNEKTTQTIELVGPRFVKKVLKRAGTESAFREIMDGVAGHVGNVGTKNAYVELTVGPNDFSFVSKAVGTYLQGYAALDVVSEGQTREQTEHAIQELTQHSVNNTDQAIADFVRTAPFENDVDRDAVRDMALQYMRKSKE